MKSDPEVLMDLFRRLQFGSSQGVHKVEEVFSVSATEVDRVSCFRDGESLAEISWRARAMILNAREAITRPENEKPERTSPPTADPMAPPAYTNELLGDRMMLDAWC